MLQAFRLRLLHPKSRVKRHVWQTRLSGAVTLCVLSFGIAQARAEETATQKQKGSPNPRQLL